MADNKKKKNKEEKTEEVKNVTLEVPTIPITIRVNQ